MSDGEVNRAVTDVLAVTVTVHVVPEHPPPENPLKMPPELGVPVSVTVVPVAKLPTQDVPQLIPAGEEVTVPSPSTKIVRFAACTTGAWNANPSRAAAKRARRVGPVTVNALSRWWRWSDSSIHTACADDTKRSGSSPGRSATLVSSTHRPSPAPAAPMHDADPSDAQAPMLPRSSAELAAACTGAQLTEVESMARRFVATHPDDEGGWQLLLHCLEQGGDLGETERLVRFALERFPALPRAHLVLAATVAQRGLPGEAAGLLRGRALSGDEGLLLAEIDLALDREEARRIYAEYARAAPAHPVVALGLRAAESLRAAKDRGAQVAFLLTEDWHGWIQRPIAEALVAQGIACVAVTRPWLLAAHRPRVVVLSSPNPPLMQGLRAALPGARLVNTRHGISVNGKNYGLYAAASCDHVCVSSEALGERTRELAMLEAERVWVTGYPQMDELFRRLRDGVASEAGRRRVLFAPTFNPELSAAYLAGEDPVSAIRGHDETIAVVLAGHPQLRRSAPQLLAAWRRLAASRPNVSFFDSEAGNITTLLADADVLVSDVSSVALQYLALDRPLVRLVDLARARATRAFAPDGDEWEVAAAATTVERRADLARAVRAALEGPEPERVRTARRRLQERFFGTLTDGRAGERIARRIAAIVHEGG